MIVRADSEYRQVREAIAHIAEEGWEPIGYTEDGEEQVAETSFVASKKKGKHRRVRVVVRRTRLTDPTQAQLWPDWRYHAFAASTELLPAEADAFHRAHARVELAIRDIKAHAGLSHCPSGNFFANAAWLACTVLAHNLYRWTEHHTSPVGQLTNGEHRPHPPVSPPRQDREPRRQTDTPPTRQMAMGRHLPHHPRQHPQPPPTLLIRPEASTKTGRKHPPQVPLAPYTLQIRPDTPHQTRQTSQQPHAPAKTPCAAPANPKPPTHTDQNGGFKLS